MRSNHPSLVALVLAAGATATAAACTLSEDSLSLESSAFLLENAADATLFIPPPPPAMGWREWAMDGMTTIGDIDGDGFDDLAVHDPKHWRADEEFPRGAVYVQYGGSAVSGEIELGSSVLEFDRLANPLVRTLAAAGDVDGDGFDDFLVVEPPDEYACLSNLSPHFPPESVNPTPSLKGVAYLVYGGRERLSGTRRITEVSSAIADDEDCAGLSGQVDGLGDIDGDGLADFALSSKRWQVDDEGYYGQVVPGSGRIHVFYGSAGRLPAGSSLEAAAATLRSGVVPIGDIEGDGRADFAAVIGNADGSAHTVYLVPGSAARLSGEIDVEDLAATRWEGSRYPHPIALGDLDGDGRADLGVADLGATADSPAYDQLFHLLYGREGGLPPVIGSADADAVFIRQETDENWGGPHAVASGDHDGDGAIDLAIADPFLAGNRGGILLVPGTMTRFAGEVRLDDAVSQSLVGGHFDLTCEENGDSYSCPETEGAASHLGTGDLDADGRADFLVSGQRVDDDGEKIDQIYVLLGAGAEDWGAED